jgi:hypothetical protein
MEIKQLATVERHEAGMEFQLVNQVTGEKEDAVFKVKGTDSKSWREASKAQRRKYQDEESIDFVDHEYLWPMVASVIISWDNLNKGGEPFEYSEENAQWLCENSPIVVSQIFAFIVDRDNFTED